jgi:hypothetical protein
MDIRFDYIREYAAILRTSPLQRDYREFVKFFRRLRVYLEKELPQFRFTGGITENGMDYAYFQFTDAAWKREGLKFVVAFVHGSFSLEVWLSGMNRETQARLHRQLQKSGSPYELSPDPNRFDYIVKEVVLTEGDFSGGDELFGRIRERVLRFADGAKRLTQAQGAADSPAAAPNG